MKKTISLILTVMLCASLCVPAFAMNKAEKDVVATSTHIINQETREEDIQRQIDEYLMSLQAAESTTRGDYDYTYTAERGTPKYVTKSGYPGGQPTRGVKFSAPGGAFSWSPNGGPTVNANVSFSFPFEAVTVAIDLGVAASNESLSYVQRVDNYTDYVKLYVHRTQEVVPIVTYRTHIDTGVREIYTRSSVSTLYSFDFDVIAQN